MSGKLDYVDEVPSTTSEPDNAPNTDVDQENLPVSANSTVDDDDDESDHFEDATE